VRAANGKKKKKKKNFGFFLPGIKKEKEGKRQ